MFGYVLITYLSTYLALAFVLPSYRVWRTTGVNPITFGTSDNAHDYVGKIFKLLLVGLFVVAGIYAFAPGVYQYSHPMESLSTPTTRQVGLFILITSLVWTVVAQVQMGRSWRIGIDETRQTELIDTGLFAKSRNPIFLGMNLTLIGLFLVIPNAFTLLFLVLGHILMQIQVRLEEAFLQSVHGDKYLRYREKTGRWFW